ALGQSSSGYMGTSDGWTDLKTDHRMDWTYDAPQPGNVVQTARTALDGRHAKHLTLAIGFGATRDAAAGAARGSLRDGFPKLAAHYAAGWRDYLRSKPVPRSAGGSLAQTYATSLMVLAASEDKTYRGAFIASPSMPWVWGNIAGYSGPYHLVWSRD